MVRPLAWIALAALALGCRERHSDQAIARQPADGGSLIDTRRAPEGWVYVSLLQLIATPERYEGQNVEVMGFCWAETEADALFLHEEDEVYGFTMNAVALYFGDARDYARPCRGEHAFVMGTFSSRAPDNYGGSIAVKVVRVQKPLVRSTGIDPP